MSAKNTLTKKERREATRARIREQRRKDLEREKRQARIRLGLLILVPVVVISLIVWFVVASGGNDEPSPAPTGANQQGGITFQSPETVLPGDLEQVDSSQFPDPKDPTQFIPTPDGAEASEEGEPVRVVIYADANCVHCAEFEQNYQYLLNNALDRREITLEYRMVNFLDYSSSTDYSTRTASAAACVVDQDPSAYLPFLSSVYDAHGTEPADGELAQMASKHGVDISDCQEEGTFDAFVEYTSAAAMATPVHATPSVWVDGQSWSDSGQDFPGFLTMSVTSR